MNHLESPSHAEPQPTVTVGLISYNAKETLTQSLQSALAQSFQPLEIVVVDDASTDGTAALAQRIAEQYPHVRVISQSVNAGASVSRNVVITQARGEFIAFFDDDDVSDFRRIELQLKTLIEYERAFAGGMPVVCHSARLQYYPDGTTRVERTMGERIGHRAPNGPAVARRVLLGEPLRDAYGSCATCSQMARTETLRRLGGFDPAFRRGQDTELCVRLAKAGAHFVGIAEPLVTQTMTKTADKGLERDRLYWLALIDKHRDVFAVDEEYRWCRIWVHVRHDWLSGNKGSFWRGLLRLAVTAPSFTLMRLAMSIRNLRGNLAHSRFRLGR